MGASLTLLAIPFLYRPLHRLALVIVRHIHRRKSKDDRCEQHNASSATERAPRAEYPMHRQAGHPAAPNEGNRCAQARVPGVLLGNLRNKRPPTDAFSGDKDYRLTRKPGPLLPR